MAEDQAKEQELESKSAGPVEAGGGQDSVPSEAEAGDMPMLAGTAASRLASQIVDRLASPHAAPASRPVRPGALWRQITRRLGAAPEERPRIGAPISRPIQPLSQLAEQQQEPAPPSDPVATLFKEDTRTKLIWRTRAPHTPDVEAEAQPDGA